MKSELLIQNSGNEIFEISKSAEKVEYTTSRTGSPGKLSFSLLETPGLKFEEGNTVRFSLNGAAVFFGYIFVRTKNRWGQISVVAYDQTRYLKANESYIFTGMNAGQIIQHIANQFNLKCGVLENTGYVIPSLIRENKSCLDIISYVVELTTRNTGKIFIFYDDAGFLSLRQAANLMTDVVIGTKSLLTDYDYKSEIDSDTHNQIKLVRPNQDTGRADTYIFKDSATIDKWGLLQRYETVHESMNPAQIAEQAKTMLVYYNRALQTLTIQSLGVPGLRAGSMVMLNIPELNDISPSQYFLLDKVTHTFISGVHTMNMQTRVISA